MSSIVLNITDESLLSRIKEACTLLKGVGEVKVLNSATSQQDITQTSGYWEALEDVRVGRITEYASVDEFFKEMGA